MLSRRLMKKTKKMWTKVMRMMMNNNTTEGGDMIIKRNEFEDTEEVADEDIKGMKEEGSKDEDNTEDVTGYDGDEEDEKREAKLTNIDSKYNKVNVVEEKDNITQV
jgi:hypothetical protein